MSGESEDTQTGSPSRPPARRRVSRTTARWIDRSFVIMVMIVPTAGVVLALVYAWRGALLSTANLVVFLVLWVTTLFAIEGGYHRYFSHRAFGTSRAFEALLAIFGSLAFQGPVIWWAATHRRHHRHADRPGDPHSPQLRGSGPRATLLGLWDAHMGWLFREVDSISRKSHWQEYVPDLLENRTIWLIHRHYMWWLALGLLLPTVLGGLLDGTLHGAFMGFLWGGLVRIFLVNHAIWAVNSICHVYGRRPFALQARDRSANNALVALLSLGAGWHHNHHVFPGYSTTQLEPWQIDGTGLLLRLLGAMRVVRDLRLPSADRRGRQRRLRVAIADQTARQWANVSSLSGKRAFLETTSRHDVGASLQLIGFEVSEPDAQHETSMEQFEPAEAVVEYVSLHGLGVRFVAPTPALSEALDRLGALARR